jgi:protein involved in polysaccharide export with SLBB domain
LVLGEVNQPGKIHITKSNTTIAEVIKKVGGFTNNASLIRGELIRDSKSVSQLILEDPIYNRNSINRFAGKLADRLKQSKMTELLLMQRMSDVVLEDTVFFSLDNKLKELQTQAVVDFTKIFSDLTEDGNFKLRDGDVIFIPTKDKYVYVYGQVNSPGLVPYVEGKDYNYYIEKAGGLGEDYEEDIKLIKSKTKSWHTVNSEINIERGDYIYVPKNPPRSWGYYLRNVSFISAIVSTIATIILVVNQNKK